MLIEKVKEKIAALDEQMAVLKEKIAAATDPEEKSTLADEIYSVAYRTNRLLRIIHAPESEMYDI